METEDLDSFVGQSLWFGGFEGREGFGGCGVFN